MAYKRKFRSILDDRGNSVRIGTTQYQLLRFINDHGTKGARHKDILKFYMSLKGEEYNPDYHRGYGSSYFSYRLPRWAAKNDSGRWILTDISIKKHFRSKKKYNNSESNFYKIANSVLDKLILCEPDISKEYKSAWITKLTNLDSYYYSNGWSPNDSKKFFDKLDDDYPCRKD